MKGQSASPGPDDDPIAAAARSLAQATADEQQAIAAALAENADAGVALAESRRECSALQAKVVALHQTVKQQHGEIAAVRANLDTLATERSTQNEHAEARALISAREHVNLAVERVALETQRSTLEPDKTRLRHDQTTLAKDTGSTSNGLLPLLPTADPSLLATSNGYRMSDHELASTSKPPSVGRARRQSE
ncbi:hypothetical protein B0H13DRAFT_2537463 [Mycena leptocephala]|nr:hypothetical protein B0H13DRAFT_2537463 [Mycena leptocephala]